MKISNHWKWECGQVLRDGLIRKVNYQLKDNHNYYNYLIGNGKVHIQ